MYGGTISLAIGVLNASNKIHLYLLKNIMRAPTAFFDTTPRGRILDRCCNDVNRLESHMMHCLRMIVNNVYKVCC